MLCGRCGGLHPGINCYAGASMLDQPRVGQDSGNAKSENIASTFPGGTVYKNSGNSHITTDNGTAHITTHIPDLGQAMKIKNRFDIPKDGF